MRTSLLLRRLLAGAILTLGAVQAQAQTAYIVSAGLPTIRGGDPSIYKPIDLTSTGSLDLSSLDRRAPSGDGSYRPIVPASSTPQMAGDLRGPWGVSSNRFATDLSLAVFQEANVERRKRGLRPLTPDFALAKAAGAHAADMISGDFFGHFAPDGRALKERLQQNAVPSYEEVAENLWEAQGRINWTIPDNQRRAIQDWLNSDKGHREALLDANLFTAGVGVAIRDGRIAVAMMLARP
ncbi:CAP domain-containing protein [Neomegalonema sp.]|uniref:CAP domain-containing protein n=1 Tax=Neomegalonema sp. TaxID=2039713 RepID=UPI0026262FE1|nr:CAP domain-containing protein [Neomegalonema sp.]MDD2868618.1 CAP domain-containing protein [Neomegalonema sp.]